MPSYYKQLVGRLGKEGARDYMRSLRKKVKKPGFAAMDKTKLVEISRKGGKARWKI